MQINPSLPSSWQDLQQQVARILSECGLAAEVEKTIATARGTANIDVYAVDANQTPRAVYRCECNHWSSAVFKDEVHGIRTVLADFGADSGFLVSSAGFQSGAVKAAEYTNVNASRARPAACGGSISRAKAGSR